MKEPNPLLPQGSFEAQARGKSHVRIAVFSILAIHVVVLGALLIQGCKRDGATGSAEPAPPTNDVAATPPFSTPDAVTSGASSNAPGPFTPGLSSANGGTGTAVAPTPGPGAVGTPTQNFAQTPGTALPTPVTPITQTPTPTPTPAPTADTGAPVTEHTVVKNDSFSVIAKKYGVSVKALQAANPGVDSTKLKVGQKIKIPAKSTTAATPGSSTVSAPAPSTAAPSADVYVVKSGDNLGNIAKSHGTTVKAIQKLNNLTTTQIRVGQKLKLPAHSGGSAPATTPPAPAPTPSPTPAPVTPSPIPAPAQ